MARNSDKKNSRNVERTLKLRQAREWAEIELDSLDEKYESEKNKRLAKKIDKINRKLERPAFVACDKAEYLEREGEIRLKEFDVENYLSYREAYHSAGKAIFADVKKGNDWRGHLTTLAGKISKIKAKRQQYITKLGDYKKKMLWKLPKGSVAAYDDYYDKLDGQYVDYELKIADKYSRLYDKEAARIRARLAKIDAKMAKLASVASTEQVLSDDVILSVRGLKMYFGGLKAVDDLTFDVKRGEIFGLIGPNGAGKTTVLNCITQFYKPTAGELLFATKDNEVITLTDYKVHDIILKGIARTFQNIEVVKEVSVLDNLLIAATRKYTSSLFAQMFHLSILKREEKMMRARADKVLKYMDLYEYRDRLAWGLPYGVLKRIEIARALMCNPQLVILDEPAAGLNVSETQELAELINKIRVDFDCTILLVEHDMSLVMNICDHICAISFGKKLAYGTAAEVQASKEVQEAYLGVGGDE
jgi:branched-chain amino acid transport system ATP-binding protein